MRVAVALAAVVLMAALGIAPLPGSARSAFADAYTPSVADVPGAVAVHVAAGDRHACGLGSDGSLACWGYNDFGDAVPPAGQFISVSAGRFHSCAVRIDNTATCWGDLAQGEPTTGKFVSVTSGFNQACGLRMDTTVVCWGSNLDGEASAPSGGFLSVSAGEAYTCGVRIDSTLACWGLNEDGQASPPSGSFLSVSAGTGRTCAIGTDHTVVCWGFDSVGGTPPAGEFASISAGYDHWCGIRPDATVECWGNNTYGQSTPPSGPFTSVSVGVYYTCGVRGDTSVICWGNNAAGQATPPSRAFGSIAAGADLGCAVRTDASVSCWGANDQGQASPPSGAFRSIAAAWWHVCGIRTDASVSCWGYNSSGESSPPAGTFTSVSAGSADTCGVRTDQTIACWGYNGSGQATPPPGQFSAVAAGDTHTCGIRVDTSVTCWGDNRLGQAAPPSGSFLSISAGSWHTCGIRSDMTLACWGDDGSPEASPPDGQFVAVAASMTFTCGIRTDATVACWGYDYGLGTTSPPTGSFASVAGGRYHACGLRTDGTLQCWGDIAIQGEPLAASTQAIPGDSFIPLNPVRVEDSRPGSLVGPYSTPWGAAATRSVTVAGVGGIPTDADAVAMNITVTNTTGSSYLVVWPAGQPRPSTSSLNWSPGWTIPNAVTMKVGASGQISVYNAAQTTDVIIDVVGYYKTSQGAGYTSLNPVRVQDSRPSSQVGPYSSPWGPAATRAVTVAGTAGIPADATAVVLNTTVTNTTGSSYLVIWPRGQLKPQTSSLNWGPRWTIPNAVTVKVGASGKINVYNAAHSADIVIDVVGYFENDTGWAFHPIAPTRLEDSRSTSPVGPFLTPWGSGTTRDLTVTAAPAVPVGARSVLLNMTATNTTGSSYLVTWPQGQTMPATSSLNWALGWTIPNAVTAMVGAAGQIRIYNDTASADVITDVTGWYG